MSDLKLIKTGILTLGMFAASSYGALALDGDAAKGEGVFKKCTACHQVGPEAKNAVGPVLNGVIGRTAGTFADYKYGKSLVEAGEAGLAWTEDELFEYLGNPKKYLRAKLDNKKAKSKMSFKLKKDEERADVIAYLKTFSPEAEAEGEGEGSTEESTTTN